MSYVNTWNETTPTSATLANTIAPFFTNNMIAIRERLDDVFGTSALTSIATKDPYAIASIRMTAIADSNVIGGAASWSVRDHTNTYNNLQVLDSGSIIIRSGNIATLSSAINFYNSAQTTINVIINDAGTTLFGNTLTVVAGGLVIEAGGLAVVGQAIGIEVNVGNVTGATNIDFNNGNNQRMVLTGNATLTFLNTGSGGTYILRIKQDGTGSRLITWTGVTWPGGAAPTLTTTAGYTDVITLYQTSGGLLGFIGALGFNV